MKFFTKHSGIPDGEIARRAAALDEYRAHLVSVVESGGYNAPEASLNLSSDTELFGKLEEMRDAMVSPSLKYIIVAGIGGSNLGAKAVYDALPGETDVFAPDRFPKILFADTNDERLLSALAGLLETHTQEPEEVLFISISKSGGTTETAANTEIIFEALQKKWSRKKAADRMVIISDEHSPLWEAAKKQDIAALSVPENIGGRYSIFSAAGLFPLLAAGIDIGELSRGAHDMLDSCLKEGGENPALVSAVIATLSYEQGKHVSDMFLFHRELESLGKWYRQLLGESIGKTEAVGILPTVSIGSTDLHSVGQLYLGGPKNIFTTFVSAGMREGIPISHERLFPEIVKMIGGKTTADISRAILEGTKIAYEKRGLPFTEIILDDLSLRSLGAFFQFKMMEVMYLGKILGVNAFDQPDVESYKNETKRILSA